MSDILDELEKAHQASTQKDWYRRPDDTAFIAVGRLSDEDFAHVARFHEPEDALFCVAAHRLVPALLAEVRALREVEQASRNLSTQSGAQKMRYEAALIALDALRAKSVTP